MRIIGYVRCSTSEQADSGAGLDAQRAALQAAATLRGYELVRIIDDPGASGKSLARPGLEEALGLIRAKQADGIIVSKLDRLSRSVIDFGNLLALAEKGGWNIVALDFGVDLSTPAGKLVANVLMAVAQWEREAIGQRTREGLAVVKQRTPEELAARNRERERLGLPPKKVIGRPRVIDETLRARIQATREQGVSLSKIAAELTAEGVPTAHGGVRWHPSTVAGMVKP